MKSKAIVYLLVLVIFATLLILYKEYEHTINRFHALFFPKEDLYKPLIIGKYDFWSKDNYAEYDLQCLYPNRIYELGIIISKIELQAQFDKGISDSHVSLGGHYRLTLKKNSYVISDIIFDGHPDVVYLSGNQWSSGPLLSLTKFRVDNCEGITLGVTVMDAAKKYHETKDSTHLFIRVSPYI
jgi:hypothetical protein